ncbi:MAG: hypothetical protein KTR31_22855 [Myxococcales bacterium]|nr:hypothetical protein [Myxococcales bacterium]
MIRIGLIALTFVAAGCGGGSGPSEADFQADFASASCALLDECGGTTGFIFDSVEDCETFYSGIFALGTIGCTYDGAAANDCLDAVDAATCDDTGTDVGAASACDGVYSGAACGIDLGTSTTGT